MATSLKLRVNIHSVIRKKLTIHTLHLTFNWLKLNRNFNQSESFFHALKILEKKELI